MAYLTPEQMQEDEVKSDIREMKAGETMNVVLTEYAPFQYGENKEKTMKKHLGFNADTNEKMQFVGFAFHDEVKRLSDQIEPGVTVLKVECLDSGSKYPDFALSIVSGGKPSDDIRKTLQLDETSTEQAF